MTGNYNEEIKKEGEIFVSGKLHVMPRHELSSLTGPFLADSDCATSMTNHFFKNNWSKSAWGLLTFFKSR